MFGDVLPLELAFHILSFFAPEEHFIVNQVSREWRDAANDKQYWKNRCKKRFKISEYLRVEEPSYRKAYFRRRAIERLWEEGVANVMHIRPPISGFSPLVRQNPNALYPQKVTKVQFDSNKVVFISMSSLFVCDTKTGDFLWNDKRIPMPKMEENLTSSDDGLTKLNNNNDLNFEAVSTQESNAHYSGSQPSSQNNNNINLGSPVQRKLNFNEVADDHEERNDYVEETNENNMNIISDNNLETGDQEGSDPDEIEQNFGFDNRNETNAEGTEELPEDNTNVLNMSLDNIGEPSLRSPLFKSTKNLKRKRGLNESLDDFESPIKRIKTNNNKEENDVDDNSEAFPNLESTPTKKTTSPKKQRNVRSPSLALLEEEDELDGIIYTNTNEEGNDSEQPNESALEIFKQEPEVHFADAYETFHFDDNILAVTLAEAPYCDIFFVTKTKLEFQRRVSIEEVCNQIEISKRQNVMVVATCKSSVVRLYNLSTGELIRSIVHPSAQALSLLAYHAKEEEASPSLVRRKFKKFINMAQNYTTGPSFTKVPHEFNPHEGCDPSGVRSIQLRGDRLLIANAHQLCMYSITDGFVIQTYKTLSSLYPKVEFNSFEIGKVQFDDDIVIACYPLNDIVSLWTAKGGELIKIKRHFTQDMKLAESRIVTLDSVRRSFSLWSWNFFYMYQVQHKIANSTCIDFNAFMIACGTVEGEVQLFDFENRVNIPSQHAHKELSQYSIHTIQSITIHEKYRNLSFEEIHYQYWLEHQQNNQNNTNNVSDSETDLDQDKALESHEKPAITYDNNNEEANNTNERNTFDYDRLPVVNLNSNESAQTLFEYESDDDTNNEEK